MLNDGVYVAGSSAEIDRAKKWMDALRAKGIPVTSTWVENVTNVGAANPRDASIEDKQKWCLQDVRECLGSKALWLLMPIGPHSFGATYEFAFFTALHDQDAQTSIVSGDYKRSIFTSFSTCFDTDEEAFEAICKLIMPACNCGAMPEPMRIEGAKDAMITSHTMTCAISIWVKPPENRNAAEPEG